MVKRAANDCRDFKAWPELTWIKIEETIAPVVEGATDEVGRPFPKAG